MNRAARRPAGDPVRRRLGLVVHDPVVVILALIAFFSAISGKPLDGLLTHPPGRRCSRRLAGGR